MRIFKANARFALLIGVLALCGCGVKPGSVEPPSPDSQFPHTYPDTATDPQ